jgi:hypothetical protein
MKSKPTYINKKHTHIQKSIFKTLSLFIERKERLKGNCYISNNFVVHLQKKNWIKRNF